MYGPAARLEQGHHPLVRRIGFNCHGWIMASYLWLLAADVCPRLARVMISGLVSVKGCRLQSPNCSSTTKPGSGQKRGQRAHVKEPQTGPLHVRPVPSRTGECLAETNDIPHDRCLDLVPDPHHRTGSVDSLERIVRCPLLPRPYHRVPRLEREAAAVDEGRSDRGERGP
jgi:hypothetical protein